MSERASMVDGDEQGIDPAGDRLLPSVYQELRKLAAFKMAHETPGHTLQPTALVHEAWLRLQKPQQPFCNRAQFFAAASEAMRRILIESARRKKRIKHGGELERVENGELPLPMPADELLALDEALDRLANSDALAAEIVKLCFFVGLTRQEAAGELGISISTAERRWSFARAWLFLEINKSRNPPG